MSAVVDRFGQRVLGERLREVMTDVLRNVPHTVAFSYAHKMWVSDLLLSVFTRQFVIKISGASIDTQELRDHLHAGLVARGVKQPVVLELEA